MCVVDCLFSSDNGAVCMYVQMRGYFYQISKVLLSTRIPHFLFAFRLYYAQKRCYRCLWLSPLLSPLLLLLLLLRWCDMVQIILHVKTMEAKWSNWRRSSLAWTNGQFHVCTADPFRLDQYTQLIYERCSLVIDVEPILIRSLALSVCLFDQCSNAYEYATPTHTLSSSQSPFFSILPLIVRKRYTIKRENNGPASPYLYEWTLKFQMYASISYFHTHDHIVLYWICDSVVTDS